MPAQLNANGHRAPAGNVIWLAQSHLADTFNCRRHPLPLTVEKSPQLRVRCWRTTVLAHIFSVLFCTGASSTSQSPICVVPPLQPSSRRSIPQVARRCTTSKTMAVASCLPLLWILRGSRSGIPMYSQAIDERPGATTTHALLPCGVVNASPVSPLAESDILGRYRLCSSDACSLVLRSEAVLCLCPNEHHPKSSGIYCKTSNRSRVCSVTLPTVCASRIALCRLGSKVGRRTRTSCTTCRECELFGCSMGTEAHQHTRLADSF